MPWGPWPGGSGGGGVVAALAAEWFNEAFVRARTLVPAAEFDTVIRVENDETITMERVDNVGDGDVFAAATIPGGALEVSVGSPVTVLNQLRLQRTGSTGHVELQTPWYCATLAKYIEPLDEAQLEETGADMCALWNSDNNRVTLGIVGEGEPGGSNTNWVGRIRNAGVNTTTLGPALDPDEAPLWHLFEMWSDGTDVHFAIDLVEFGATLDAADLPAVPARLSPIVYRTATGDLAAVLYEKHAVVVRSPQPGTA